MSIGRLQNQLPSLRSSVMVYSLVDGYQWYEGNPLPQSSIMKTEAAGSSETVPLLTWIITAVTMRVPLSSGMWRRVQRNMGAALSVWLVFGRRPIRISVGTPIISTEVFVVIEENAGIVPQNCPRPLPPRINLPEVLPAACLAYGSSTFLRSVHKRLPDYTTSRPRR